MAGNSEFSAAIRLYDIASENIFSEPIIHQINAAIMGGVAPISYIRISGMAKPLSADFRERVVLIIPQTKKLGVVANCFIYERIETMS